MNKLKASLTICFMLMALAGGKGCFKSKDDSCTRECDSKSLEKKTFKKGKHSSRVDIKKEEIDEDDFSDFDELPPDTLGFQDTFGLDGGDDQERALEIAKIEEEIRNLIALWQAEEASSLDAHLQADVVLTQNNELTDESKQALEKILPLSDTAESIQITAYGEDNGDQAHIVAQAIEDMGVTHDLITIVEEPSKTAFADVDRESQKHVNVLIG